MHLSMRKAPAGANTIAQIHLWLLLSWSGTVLHQLKSIVGTSYFLCGLNIRLQKEPKASKRAGKHNPSPFTAGDGNQSTVTGWQLTRNRGGQVRFLMNCFCMGKAPCPNKRKPAVMATKPCVCIYKWKLMCMWGSRREQKAVGVSLPRSAFSFCHMHCSHCLHWPPCQWQIVMSVCIMPGSALSLRMSVHGRKGSGRKEWYWALLAHAKNGQKERKEESEKDIQKESLNQKREIGRMRTFLRSLVSEFQGSYVVVSQQPASSAAYNTHGVLCATTGWTLYYTTESTSS